MLPITSSDRRPMADADHQQLGVGLAYDVENLLGGL